MTLKWYDLLEKVGDAGLRIVKDDGLNKNVHNKKRKKTLRFLLFGVASFVFVMYFFSLVVNMSLEIVGKYKEKDSLNDKLDDLREEEQELSTYVLKLQDPEYIGRYLREKYYYSKDDEYIIKLPSKK